ncbi:MAG: hypothetical protein JW702_04295 [Clostridiales bacterium]|nr:hypothetical protein [Clostridiales bacterium]
MSRGTTTDEIPNYNAFYNVANEFTGSRIKRGFYKSVIGTTLNADIKGAINILKKRQVAQISLE